MSNLAANEFFIFGIDGLALQAKIKPLLKLNNGGIILFKRNIESMEQLLSLNKEIIESNEAYPPLISVDQEGGRVARLRGICSDMPPMYELKSAFNNDKELCYRVGAMIGRELVALGFNLNFAPVCDISVEQKPDDIIGDRAFSSDAQEAALFSELFIKGMQGAGLAGSAKHFPGHGSTIIDSHFSLPTIVIPKELFHERELVPFKAAIQADVATIMTAHIVASSLDTIPATLSKTIISGLLRKELSYEGVVISDDLDMKAVADHYNLKEIIETAFMAEVDMFIIGNNFDKTVEAIAILDELIKTNKHIEQQAQKALGRIRKLRSRYLGAPAIPNENYAKKVIRSRPHLELLASCR